MDPSITPPNSQKLIRCTVTNKDNSPTSLRYVEFEHYKLWSYMMLHKHGIKVTDASLWLWIEKKEFEEKKELYTHFPTIESVNRIELLIFDELYGFTHETYRFAPEHETDLLEKALLSHISPEFISANNYDMKSYPGYCIKCGKNLANMTLGISGADTRQWYRKS